ncbi:MAG: EamA family transporter [Xanthobacteraceae bacterium]|jgi:drug/metabolite transporter (DMT)-like permease|nr:EamA family transporter [Xanthobacteraceae bacterium]
MTTIPEQERAADALPLTGYALGAAGAILFSAKGIIIKLAYAEGIDAETLLALRMLLSLPFYLVIGFFAVRAMRERGEALPSRALVLKAAGIGALGYWFSSYMDFLGLIYISASFERLILFTYPLFVVLFGALFFRQPIRRRALFAFAASYAGLAVIFAQNFSAIGQDATRGTVFVLVAAMSFALYQLTARTVIGQIGSKLFTCIAMGAAAAATLTQFVLLRPISALVVSPHMFWLAVAIAIGATVLPTFLMNAALQRISAQANSTIGTISPVATMILAVLILGETVTPLELGGAILVMVSIGWFTLADSRR